MRLLSVIALACALAGTAQAASAPDALELPVSDPTAVVARPIARGLHLVVRRQFWANGDFIGWDVGVYRDRAGRGFNLLYHSRRWHGAHPSQVFAWSEAERYFGTGERVLPVRGRKVEVRVVCLGRDTRRSGDHAVFTTGVLRVAWGPTGPQG